MDEAVMLAQALSWTRPPDAQPPGNRQLGVQQADRPHPSHQPKKNIPPISRRRTRSHNTVYAPEVAEFYTPYGVPTDHLSP